MTDVESVSVINRLPKAHRPIIGRIIWWDWFGGRLVSKRTTAFDQWLQYSADPEPDWKELVKSLMSLGYPEEFATRKLRPKFQQPKKGVTRAN